MVLKNNENRGIAVHYKDLKNKSPWSYPMIKKQYTNQISEKFQKTFPFIPII